MSGGRRLARQAEHGPDGVLGRKGFFKKIIIIKGQSRVTIVVIMIVIGEQPSPLQHLLFIKPSP